MARDMVQVARGRGANYQGPQAKIGRSQFNRSHGLKTTFDAGYLVPIMVDEVLPGDTFTCRLDGFARIFSPLESPVMDNIQLETFFFFIPNRLLWVNWEAFNGAHDAAGAQDTDYTIPVLNSGSAVVHSSPAHYMGIPVGLDFSAGSVNALPFRAYRLCYNEWFRDQNLVAETNVETDNGPDTQAWGTTALLLKSAKKHDYFTSAMPYVQKGDPVSLAFTADAEVTTASGNDVDLTIVSTAEAGYRFIDAPGGTNVQVAGAATSTGKLFADLQNMSGGITVNALRQSVAIQRLLERDARGGTRYTEIIKSHFGVTSPDFRLQRPEYLGGGKAMINISPVANTSGVDSTVSISGADEPQGELRGVGTGIISGHGWAKSFTEHGIILGLVRARGDISYFQGLDRMWSRSTRYDFYIPALANLGEQSVLNKELYVSNSAGTDDAVFGYQERWAEYRMKKSVISGKFDPNASGALSMWHLAEDFASLPTLNQTFIEDQTPMSRVQTVTTEPDFLLDVWFNLKCARPMPVFSVPSLISRF